MCRRIESCMARSTALVPCSQHPCKLPNMRIHRSCKVLDHGNRWGNGSTHSWGQHGQCRNPYRCMTVRKSRHYMYSGLRNKGHCHCNPRDKSAIVRTRPVADNLHRPIHNSMSILQDRAAKKTCKLRGQSNYQDTRGLDSLVRSNPENIGILLLCTSHALRKVRGKF